MLRAFIAIALAASLQSSAPQVASHFTVLVPTQTTELRVQGEVIAATGISREIDTRPLEAGKTYDYTFVAEWAPNNYVVLTRTRTVRFTAGNKVVVNLTADTPTDRAKIRYVTTPDEVVDAMVNMAGITSSDVVFEPGCGDARITRAAVAAGAKRGVGVDIDAKLVALAQEKVKEAGLDSKIEIRLGDALDIKDLSDASVVFLYMSDEFDKLIRPILWRDLKVGARIVSHRFTMGDRPPDRTLGLTIGDGDYYLVHVWTVTPEIKARASAIR